MKDIYMKLKTLHFGSISNEQLLNSCILIRDIGDYFRGFTHKFKEYQDNGKLISDRKINLDVDDLEKGKKFLEAVGYEVFLNMNERLIEYANDKNKICIQKVENLGVFVEIESENGGYFNGNSYDELKTILDTYVYNIVDNDYYAKKVLLMIKQLE
jgi:adenylate cyclase class IV